MDALDEFQRRAVEILHRLDARAVAHRVALLHGVLDEHRRGHQGQGPHPVRVARGEGKAENAAHRLAAIMHVGRAEMVQQRRQVADKRVQRDILG